MGDSEIAARYDLTVNKVDSVHRFLKENSFYTHHFRLYKIIITDKLMLCKEKSL